MVTNFFVCVDRKLRLTPARLKFLARDAKICVADEEKASRRLKRRRRRRRSQKKRQEGNRSRD